MPVSPTRLTGCLLCCICAVLAQGTSCSRDDTAARGVYLSKHAFERRLRDAGYDLPWNIGFEGSAEFTSQECRGYSVLVGTFAYRTGEAPKNGNLVCVIGPNEKVCFADVNFVTPIYTTPLSDLDADGHPEILLGGPGVAARWYLRELSTGETEACLSVESAEPLVFAASVDNQGAVVLEWSRVGIETLRLIFDAVRVKFYCKSEGGAVPDGISVSGSWYERR